MGNFQYFTINRYDLAGSQGLHIYLIFEIIVKNAG